MVVEEGDTFMARIRGARGDRFEQECLDPRVRACIPSAHRDSLHYWLFTSKRASGYRGDGAVINGDGFPFKCRLKNASM